MLVRQTALPAYNVQTAVDAEHALIVAHAVVLDASDIRCLKPMAEAAKQALEVDTFNVVADAGYSNGEQVAHCEAAGMIPHVPVMRTVNNQGDGTLFGRTDFRYEPESDTYICPGDKRLLRKHTNHKDRYTMYKASSADCGACSLKSRCTQAPRRGLARHLYEDALNRMQKRVTPEAMRLRRCTVEHPFATIKYRIFGHPRLLMRGLNRCTSRNRHRDNGLQPEAHHQCARCSQTNESTPRLTEQCTKSPNRTAKYPFWQIASLSSSASCREFRNDLGMTPQRFSLACLGFFLFRDVQRGYFSFHRERSEIVKADGLLLSAEKLPWRNPLSSCRSRLKSDSAIWHQVMSVVFRTHQSARKVSVNPGGLNRSVQHHLI